MGKTQLKLIAAVLMLAVAGVMIATVSYAWVTLSEAPVANGISIALSGDTSILLAADVTETVTGADGGEIVIHYPDSFENTLVFSQKEAYGYLKELAGLEPVSTADGLYWIRPSYDRETGKLMETTDFEVEDTLAHANAGRYEEGGYIYLDFWIVSPGARRTVRISTDRNGNGGSFLVELPDVTEDKTEDEARYTLTWPDRTMEASARVGFLTNTTVAETEDMVAYTQSAGYDERFQSLRGVYQEKGTQADMTQAYSFAIYEPNGTLHPGGENGAYIKTNPLSYWPATGTISEGEVGANLTVQKESAWLGTDSGLLLEELFQSELALKRTQTLQDARNVLYRDHLQGQVWRYLSVGRILTSTARLYARCQGLEDTVPAEVVETLEAAGAAEDAVVVTLERDTPQRVRMFVWLEGQDIDCDNHACGRSSVQFALGIELAGALG